MANKQNDVLYLIWKDPDTSKSFVVGELSKGENYKFKYGKECSLAKKYGWQGIVAFPEDKVYESQTLFPVFSSRLPDPKRRDINTILRKYGLVSYNAYELLKRNGGKLPIDTYEFREQSGNGSRSLKRV